MKENRELRSVFDALWICDLLAEPNLARRRNKIRTDV
jgi:hypothetical protein